MHQLRHCLSSRFLRPAPTPPLFSFLFRHMSTLLSCQRDSYLREGVSAVLRCDELTPPESASGTSDSKQYALTLKDSVLYPEGGGQPFDLGTCGGQRVLRVEACEGGQEGQVRVVVPEPVEAGAMVQCIVDWDRRYDFMQQHTGQHLFSAVMWEMFEADTVKWELGSKSVAVDFQLAHDLTTEQLQLIESRVNMYIRENRLISYGVFKKESLDDIPLLRGGPKGAAANFEELRIVTIEGLDANPCGGTHLRSTAEIQMFSIVSSEVDRGSLRLRFLAGNRVLAALQQSLCREQQLSVILSVAPAEQAKVVDSLLQDKKAFTKAMKATDEELSLLLASHVVQRYRSRLDDASTGIVPAIVLHRPGASLPFLQAMAECILQMSDDLKLDIKVVYLSGADPIPVITSAKAGKKKKGGGPSTDISKYFVSSLAGNVSLLDASPENGLEGIFVLYGVPSVVTALKEPLYALVGGRGGGRPGKLQGTATSLQMLRDVESLVQVQLSNMETP